MTAPTYQSTTVTDFGSDATTHDVAMPASVSAGDLLLAFAAFDSSSTTITTPSGWTKLTAGPTTDPVAGIYAKRADGTEGGTTVDFATSNSQKGAVGVIRVSNWAGYVDSLRWFIFNASSAAVGELGLGSSSKDYLIVAGEVKSTSTAFGSDPSGYSNATKSNVSQDANDSGAVATATKTLSGATVAVLAASTFWNATTSTAFAFCIVAIPGIGQMRQAHAQSAIGI